MCSTNFPDPPLEISEKIIQDPTIFNNLCSLSNFTHAVRPDSLNRPTNLFQVHYDAMSAFFMQFKGEVDQRGKSITVTSPPIRIAERFPSVSFNELIKRNDISEDWLTKQIIPAMKREISFPNRRKYS